MTRVTVYCVQPFWRVGATKLARGDMQKFMYKEKARRAGVSAARRLGGAIVYSVTGCPEFETWEEPKLVEAIGVVPEVKF